MNEYVKEMLEEIGVLDVTNPVIVKDIVGEGYTAREEIELLYDEATLTIEEEALREYIYNNEISFYGMSEIINNLKYFEAPFEFQGEEFVVNGKIIIK